MLELSLWRRKHRLLIGSVLFCLTMSCTSRGPRIDEDDLKNAEKVVARAQSTIPERDRAAADRLFDIGVRAEEEGGNWGAAIKAYGESAVADPRPRTFVRLGTAELRMLSSRPGTDKNAILTSLRDYYKLALAVDGAKVQFTDAEREGVRNEISCIDRFLVDGRLDEACHAVQIASKPTQ